jgi:hypothetical protein
MDTKHSRLEFAGEIFTQQCYITNESLQGRTHYYLLFERREKKETVQKIPNFPLFSPIFLKITHYFSLEAAK